VEDIQIPYQIKNKRGISVEYDALLFVDSQMRNYGWYTIADDVCLYFRYQISYPRACNILRRLHHWGLLHRDKEDKQERRGPRKFKYSPTETGEKKCEYLHNQGFDIRDDYYEKQTKSSYF
jgi:DNA-binding PadR family transcriptional regulator